MKVGAEGTAGRGRGGARERGVLREGGSWGPERGAEGAVDIRYIIKRSQVLMTDRQEEVLICPTVEGNEFQEAVRVPSPRKSRSCHT